jgi:hypothetical protein
MPIEEYHVLMLTSFIAATLCMTIISITLSHEVTYGGISPLMYAVWMFSFAWVSVLLYIVDCKRLSFGDYFLSFNKIFLITGYLLFLIGVGSFSKAIFVIIRRKEAEEARPKSISQT